MSRRATNSAGRPFARGHSSLVVPARRQRRGGFALLITVTLLAFLVLLLVSLASLTRVETQVASNSQQLSQARQNALMALNIALGQLQKYAGPDQRTTARSDLQNAPGQPNRQWIGVYGSAVRADYAATPETIATDLSDTTKISATTGSPARLLNWLVSGNETTAFNPVWSATDVGDKGQITTPTPTLRYQPTDAVTGLAATTAPTSDLTIKSTSNQARLLVGEHSVTSSQTASGQPVDYVVAPAVNIDVAASAVPGAGASDTVTVGRYAWWVGDEGMKARANLPLAGTETALTAAQKLEQQRNAFSNSTRAAIELMATASPALASDALPLNGATIDTLYDPGHDALADIVSPGQIPLASTGSAAMSTALKNRFHDVSTVSTTVLADTYAGGLKRDLSILLDSAYPSPGTDSTTADATRLWTRHSGATGGYTLDYGIPTWKHLRSYYQTRIPTSGGDALKVSPRLPVSDKTGSADDVGVGPVITYFSMGYRASAASTPVAAGTEIHMNLYPLVVIWNPYNFILKAPVAEADGSNYEVGVYPTYNVVIGLEKLVPAPADPANPSAPPSFIPTRIASFDFQRGTAGTPANYEFIRFRLKCPDIPPGQSLIFSLPATSSGQLYTQKNILENIEPEPGAYVSVPFLNSGGGHLAIATGEETLEYQLNQIVTTPVPPATTGSNLSSSFLGGGGINIYLGQPDNASLILASGGSTPQTRSYYNPSSPTPARRWYNTAQQMDWSGLKVTLPFQEPGRLVHDTVTSEPAYVFQTQTLFSGQGSNAQLNGNQFMFATRWLAQGNLRATRSGRTRRDNNYNVLFTATAGQPASADGFPWQKFNIGPGSASNRTSAGRGHDWINGAPVDVPLFEFPYENQPLQSIGQLQHANLSLVGAYPSYPVGNSLADFRLHGQGGTNFGTAQPPGWQLARIDNGSGKDYNTIAYLGVDMNAYYDVSYLLNRTLWDRYYFSTVPAAGAVPATLSNPRHTRYDPSVNLQNPDRSAAGLVLAGGFNINSTSEQAWRAVLGGGNQLAFDPQNPDSASTQTHNIAFPRFTRPNGDDDPDDVWKGYRTLDEHQVAQLARNIVAEIRARGPFVSLSDFVNRRLLNGTGAAYEDKSFRGPIQAAIDNTTSSADRGEFPANDGTRTFWSQDELIGTSGSYVNQGTQYDLGYYSRPGVEGRLLNSTAAAAAAARPYGNRSAFAPKYITQADILAKIGSGLTARSDTFTIRTYGEVVNPVTNDINGRAWCEAVVQRLPEYVEPAVNAWDAPVAGSTSQTFGRKFKIISFRWLSPNDI